MTVQELTDRIKKNGAGHILHSGSEDTVAGGVAVTYTPSLDVLRKAVESHANVIIAREGPYWTRKPDALAGNPTFVHKRDFIDKHSLAVLQLRDGPQAGLAEALGWSAANGIYFPLAEMSLESLAKSIEAKLKIRAVRVIGDPGLTVKKVALTHGRMMVPELQKVLREPAVDAVIIGEPIEWEASPYFQDLLATGQKKGLIAIGLEASEEPVARQTAAWIKTFVGEVPVGWIASGEPFTVLK
jgi:putative NIF3 family GTP cyclohydrolase 1 type 2